MLRQIKARRWATALVAVAFGGLAAVALAQPTTAPAARRAGPPNVVILLADDLGYADVGFHGSDIQTPNLDRFAQQGVRLERFYCATICSPTRAGLLTGRWPTRFGLQNAVVPPWRDMGMPPEEVTFAEVLADAGYERRGIIGKWHLGHAARKYLPTSQGFTYFYGHYNGAIDYFTHEREGETDWHRATPTTSETVHEEGYSTDLLAADAVRFVDEAPRDKPYLLYVPFNAPHAPYEANEAEIAKYPDRPDDQHKRTYAAMVDSLDQGIGKVLAAIDARGDGDDTFVLFCSDNGGLKPVSDNGPMRGGKLNLFEGGVRVVAAVRYPAGGLVGGRVCNERMGYVDVMPTLRRLAGLADRPPANPLDGIDVYDAMCGRATLPDRPWFGMILQTAGQNNWSVENDEWKLMLNGRDPTAPAGEGKILLFNLKDDPREQRDVSTDRPDVVDELTAQLVSFRGMAGPERLPTYGQGQKNFKAPKDWIVGD